MEDQPAGYRRALVAEPRLRAVVALVDALCTLVRPTDRLCSGCVWETIVKPLTTPWIGWERGYVPEQAQDAPRGWSPVCLADLLAEQDERATTATTATERWLRTSEAWEAFTDVLLSRLDAADTGNGHGCGRRQRAVA